AWSDACIAPVTAAGCATDLERLLSAAGIAPPYVFVGHSYASFVLHMYAVRHPQHVAGLVLVDPIYPDEWLTLTRRERWRISGGVFLSRVGGVLARIGFVGACLTLL